MGQQTMVSVLDGNFGDPIPSAHVKFTNIETQEFEYVITDLDGKAILPEPENFGNKLEVLVTFIGMKPHKQTITKGSTVKIKLFDQIEMLKQMVVTGQFSASSPEKAVHKITLISKEKIEALNAVSLDQVLNRELNMNISQDGVLGSSISIQGLSGENVKILVDGVPMVGRLNGSIDLSQINLNDIERIEVVEGPLSVSYGSNALAGTINLITKKGSAKPLSASAKYYTENIGTHNINTRFGFSKGKHFGAVTFTRNYFDGWNIGDPVFGNPESIADSSRVKLWKPRTQNLGGLKYGYNLKNGSILYNINGFDEKITNKGNPRGPYNEIAFDDKYLTQRLDNSLTLNLKVDSTNNLQVIAAYNYYQRQKLSFITDLTGVTSVPNETPGANDTTKTDLSLMRATYSGAPKGQNWRYQLGTDLNYETVSGARILNQKQAIGDFAGFASLEWQPVFNWTFRPGIRMSYNTKYGAPVVPSLYIKYQLKPSMSIRGSIARGFRAPSVKELFMDFVDINHDIHGNPDLQAETALHTSVNYTYTRLAKGRMLKLKFGVFYNQIQNKITLAQVNATQYAYANVDEALSLGFNTEGQYTIGHIKANVGFSLTGTQNTIESITPLPIWYSPQVTSSVSYSLKKAKMDLNIFYKYTGEIAQVTMDSENNLNQNFIGSYTLLDLTANKKLWKNHLILGLGVKNILNVTNISTTEKGGAHGGPNGTRPIAPGRVLFLKLGVQL
tara:strand:+ start:16472 stop:18661 length:2190 start_codon:yes stop_codon:yes gene_type:complete